MSVPKTESVAYALQYANLGWPVLPVHSVQNGACTCRATHKCETPGKHPRARHGVNDATTDPNRIRSWWKRWSDANLGIATGTESGIVAIDIDPRNGGNETFAKLEKELGKLPATVTAKTGGGGTHFLVSYSDGFVGCRTGVAPGIDIKGDGGYIVAVPSNHISGGTYQWHEYRDPESIPLAELPLNWANFLTRYECYRETERQRDRDSDEIEDSEAITKRFSNSKNSQLDELNADNQQAVIGAIHRTIPLKPGQRNGCLFQFARALKGIDEVAAMPVDSLRPLINRWYEMAKPHLSGEHGLDDCWNDFVYGWSRVRCPGDFDLIDLAERVVGQPAHPACREQCYTNPRRVLLVGICAELQEIHDDRPFFLSAHKAAKVLSHVLDETVHPMVCYRILDGFVQDGVLRIVKRGNEHVATRYIFIWKPGKGTSKPTAPSWLKQAASPKSRRH